MQTTTLNLLEMSSWDTSGNSFQVTAEEQECVELIARRLIPLRVFRMLGMMPIKSKKKERDWYGHIIPGGIYCQCNECNESNIMDFTVFDDNLPLRYIAGRIVCGNCANESTVWLMDPEKIENQKMSGWREIWISPPLIDKEVELPPEVDDEDFRRDFREAAQTLPISTRASAVLSRYCLQRILVEKVGVAEGNLKTQINEAISSNRLPSHLHRAIKAIRSIGNLGAHATRSNSTGDILKVEIGEAELLLQTLRSLFDFYYVQAAEVDRTIEETNARLREAGRERDLIE